MIQNKPSISEGCFSASLEKALFCGLSWISIFFYALCWLLKLPQNKESLNHGNCIVLADAHPLDGSRGKNQYPLKSMIPVLGRENILADIFIIRNCPGKFVCTKNPAGAGLGFFYAAVKPWAASASVNSSFFSPLSLPLRSMM